MLGRRSQPIVLLGMLAVSGVVSSPCSVEAQRRRPPPEAVRYYQRARDHYRAGRYQQAAEDLERARMLDPESPTLHYNLGRVYELMGQLDKAIRYYEAYLRLLPEGEVAERDRVRGILVRLRGAREQMQRTGHRQQRAVGLRWAGEERYGARYVERHVLDLPVWLLLGVSAAGLLAGAGTGAMALVRKAEVDGYVLNGMDRTEQGRTRLDEERRAWALASDISLGVGAAAAVGATLLYLLRTEVYEELPSGARAVREPVREADW